MRVQWVEHKTTNLRPKYLPQNKNALLWLKSITLLAGRFPVDQWYSEIKDYDFNYPGFKNGTGELSLILKKTNI